MKHNYLLYIILFFLILFRGSIINIINNIGSIAFIKNDNIKINLLNKRVDELEKEYQSLLTFKNNIYIEEDYIITNIYKNNYSYNKLIINGDNYRLFDEVVTNEGLIGIITKINHNYSEVSYIYDINIPVKINDTEGKITGKDANNNLIIKELSNYNDININDIVYSANDTYIGKVISIKKEDLDTIIIVKTVNTKNINYVGVITR